MTTKKQLTVTIKNLIAVLVITGGALVGSFFVDITHMLRGSGFTDKAVEQTSIIKHDQRTWVAYDAIPIPVIVLSADDCESCQKPTDEILTWLRYVMPTLQPTVVDVRSPQGQRIITQNNIVSIPAIIFDDTVVQTSFFTQADALFDIRNDNTYILRIDEIGIIAGRYVRTPQSSMVIGDGDISIRAFMQFSCKECTTLHNEITSLMKNHENRIKYSIIYAPSKDDDTRGDRAMLAVQCAHEQNITTTYMSELFRTERQWRRYKNDRLFITAAYRVKIENITQFKACLSENRYTENIEKDKEEATRFSSPVPASFFIDTKFIDATNHTLQERQEILREAIK